MSKKVLQKPGIETPSKSINLQAMYPVIREVLDNGGTFTLTITGQSMYPFILGNRDRVTLSAVPAKLRKNDLPLYIRTNGQFVLHRVVKVCKDGTYTCCGDHQWALEPGLRHEQMVGLATVYVRKGRTLTNKSLLYRIYRTVWTWVIPLRRYFFALDSRLRRLFGKKK